MFVGKTNIHRNSLRKLVGSDNITILTFHRIIPEGENYFIPPMALSTKNFRNLLQLIDRHFSYISLDEAVLKLREGVQLPKRSISLTFDDGYRDNFTVVLDILNKYGMKATFFIPVNPIEKQENYWWDILYQVGTNDAKSFAYFAHQHQVLPKSLISLIHDIREKNNGVRGEILRECVRSLNMTAYIKREQFVKELRQITLNSQSQHLLLNWDEVKEILKKGHEIGSHTLSHRPLTQLSEAEARKEISESKAILSKKIGQQQVMGFSYPRGDWNQKIADMVVEGGYSYAVTTRYGSNNRNANLYALARRNISDYQGIRAYMPTVMYWLEFSGIFDKVLAARRSE
ncbi:MAG: hypothetical protein FJ241_12720 [Nitrospira sp.]|nr:hypothetical protein [Nitrospira sp.]